MIKTRALGGTFALLLLTLVSSGCASLHPFQPDSMPATATRYAESLALLEAGRHDTAAAELEALLQSGSEDGYRSRILLALAYSRLQLDQPDRALQLADAVLRQDEPQQPDYALYLRASALLATRPAPTAEQVRQAADDLQRLQQHYPGSRYAGSTKDLLARITKRLADTELRAARAHLQRGEYSATLNRCRYLIEHYSGSAVVSGALETMAAAYRQLGLEALADSTDAIRDNRQR